MDDGVFSMKMLDPGKNARLECMRKCKINFGAIQNQLRTQEKIG